MTSSPCKHPMVRVVSRHDEAEFVECQSCGEVFDSIEYADMELEAREVEDGGEVLPSKNHLNGTRNKVRKQGARRV